MAQARRAGKYLNVFKPGYFSSKVLKTLAGNRETDWENAYPGSLVRVGIKKI